MIALKPKCLSVLGARLVVISARFLSVCLTLPACLHPKLTRVQGILNKSMKPAMGRCRGHDGPSMARKRITSSWTGVSSQRMIMALPCYAIWYALRLGDTCTWTIVAAIRMIIPISCTMHINERILPNPDLAKDWVTHSLHWRRMGEFVANFVCNPPHLILRFQR
jgi:hypothetical protein